MGYRLDRGLTGYLLICCNELCNNLFRCKNHINRKPSKISYNKFQFKDFNTKPNYGYEEKKSLYCFTRNLPGMIDVKNKRCKYPCCTTQPIYGYKGEQCKFCSLHKLNGMIDV